MHRCPSNMSASRPIRVCFMIDRLSPGGTELQLLQLIERLDRSLVEPYLCLLNGRGEQFGLLDRVDCPVLRLRLRALLRPSSFLCAWRFARFLRRERIDVLQLYFHDSTCFGLPIARLVRVPCLVRTRRSLERGERRIDRWLGRLCSRLAGHTLVNSEACRRAAIVQDGSDPDSVVMIP